MGNFGSIQIQLTVTDLFEQTKNKYSEDDLAKILPPHLLLTAHPVAQ